MRASPARAFVSLLSLTILLLETAANIFAERRVQLSGAESF